MPIQSWLSRANRTGSFTTNAIVVPSNIAGWYWIRTNIQAAQITDATRSLSVLVEVSEDGGQVWQPFFTFTWTGCPIWKGSGNPCLIVNATGLAGKTIRATITVSRQTNIGMDIETV